MTYVYVLRDPRGAAVRYVGITNDPLRRFERHLIVRATDGRTWRGRWVNALLRRGVVPRMEILCSFEDPARAQLMEMRLISELREAGFSLTNGTAGGELGQMSRVRNRRKHRTSKMKASAPVRSTPHEALFRELVARVTKSARSATEELALIRDELEQGNGTRKE
jgi:predicted GIY-YIG superfamily endonuclease